MRRLVLLLLLAVAAVGCIHLKYVDLEDRGDPQWKLERPAAPDGGTR